MKPNHLQNSKPFDYNGISTLFLTKITGRIYELAVPCVVDAWAALLILRRAYLLALRVSLQFPKPRNEVRVRVTFSLHIQ